MRASLNRLFIVSVIACFPLAIMGKLRERSSPRTAIRFYYSAIIVFIIFLCLLALYTYSRGGNFIKVIGTFY